MALSDEQRVEVNDLAELTTRRHMAALFERTLPRIISASLSAHNHDCRAHGGVAKRVDKLRWLLIGVIAGSGVAGGGLLAKLCGLV